MNLSKQDETILSIIENQSNRTSQAIQDEVVRAKNAEAQISGNLQDLVNVTEQDIQRNIEHLNDTLQSNALQIQNEITRSKHAEASLQIQMKSNITNIITDMATLNDTITNNIDRLKLDHSIETNRAQHAEKNINQSLHTHIQNYYNTTRQLKSDILYETKRASTAERQEIDRAMLAEDALQKRVSSATLNLSKQDETILSIIENQSITSREALSVLNQSYKANHNRLHDVENMLQRIVATLHAHNISLVNLNSSLTGLKSYESSSVSKTVLANIPQDHLVYILAMLFLFNAGNISYSLYLKYLVEANKNTDDKAYAIRNENYRRKGQVASAEKSIKVLTMKLHGVNKRLHALQQFVLMSRRDISRGPLPPIPPRHNHKAVERDMKVLRGQIKSLESDLRKQRHINQAFKYKYRTDLSVKTRDAASRRLFGLDPSNVGQRE